MDDRRVRGPHRVKHIAGDEHNFRRDRNDLVDRPLERGGDVRFALIDPGGRLPLVLAETQMQIGYVDQPHGPKYRPRNALRHHRARCRAPAVQGMTRTHCVTFMRNRMASAVFPELGATVDRTAYVMRASLIQPRRRSITRPPFIEPVMLSV